MDPFSDGSTPPHQADSTEHQGRLCAEMGRTLCRNGNPAQGLEWLIKASQMTPRDPTMWLDMGTAFLQLNRTDLARQAFLSAASLSPDQPSVLLPLAEALLQQKCHGEALTCFSKLIIAFPGEASLHNNLGLCLLSLNRRDEAVEAFQQAVDLSPDLVPALNNLAMLRVERGENDTGIALYHRLRHLRPDMSDPPLNQGVAHYREGRMALAEIALREAVALAPEKPLAHYALAQVLLLQGQWREGFAEYVWRWRFDGFPSRKPDFCQPQWQGQPLSGGRLLVHAEQGYGDSLHFCRFLSRAAEISGNRVLFLHQPGLEELMKSLPGVDPIAEGSALPPFDAVCPLLDLPNLLGPGFDLPVPYLQAPHPGSPPDDGCLHVGVVWSGNPRHGRDWQRSLPLSCLSSLPVHPNLCYHSLQYQPAEGWRQAFRTPIHDMAATCHGFSDLADAMTRLHLMISIDSAPLHLAAALGIPCWGLLHHLPDWRWGMTGTVSPWYPASLSLFRQEQPRNWKQVMENLSVDLTRLADKLKSNGLQAGDFAARGQRCV